MNQREMSCSLDPAERRAIEQEEETAGEKLRGGFRKVGDQLSEWGILSPRLMLAGGGLFMTLSNWGLLPAVRFRPRL